MTASQGSASRRLPTRGPGSLLRVVGFAVLYVAMVVVGRATRIEGTQFALVWPAVGVAVLWVASSWRDRRARWTDLAVLVVVTVGSNRWTGAELPLSLAFGAANAVNAATVVAVVERLRARAWRLAEPADLTVLVLAAAVGAAASGLVGPLAVASYSDATFLPTLLSWVLRNTVGVLVLAPVGLRLISDLRPPTTGLEPVRGAARAVEYSSVGVVALGVHLLVFTPVFSVPLVYLVIPIAVWAGLRLPTTAAAVYAACSATAIIVLNLVSGGPYRLLEPLALAGAAQLLIGVITVLTLFVALERDSRQRLADALADANRRIAEQVTIATASHDRLASVLDAATEQSIVAVDRSGCITVFNAGAERMLGWSAEEMVGRSVLDLHDGDELRQRAADAGTPGAGLGVVVADVAPGRAATRQWTFRTRDGRPLQVMLSITAVPSPSDPVAVAGYIGVGTDITHTLEEEAARRSSEQRFRLLFETSPVAMALVELTTGTCGHVREANGAFAALTGLATSGLVGRDVLELSHPDDVEVARANLAALTGSSHGRLAYEQRFVRPDGSVVWALCSGATVDDASAAPVLVLLAQDITSQKVTEQALQEQVFRDPLTGLGNRRLMNARLDVGLESIGDGGRVALLYADLDGFKAVNDSAGHAVGDEVLAQIARRLEACVRDADTVVRVGGDEFAVVCTDVDEDAIVALAERIRAAVTRPIAVGADTFRVGISLGVAVGGQDATRDSLVGEADGAMYEDKRASRSRPRHLAATGHTKISASSPPSSA